MRAGRAGAEPYHHPACRAGDQGGGRRVGTLPRLHRTDARTVHDRHAHAAPVPPTRRGGERRGPYRRPVCRTGPAGERRVGTLPRPRRTDACTVHNGRARAAPVPPTRRGAGQGRTVARSAIPVRLPAPARRNPAQATPDRRPYRPRPACSRGTRTPYAPGAGEPGSGEGSDEQSAPAARNVAIARRASATESGSPASYTTPQTTRRPRLARTNHSRRSAHGTTVTRQSRTLTLTSHPQAPGSAPPTTGAPTPAPT